MLGVQIVVAADVLANLRVAERVGGGGDTLTALGALGCRQGGMRRRCT